MRTFAGGGGLGDSVYILAKFRQLSHPGDELIYVASSETALHMVEAFYVGQHVNGSYELVRDTDAAIRELGSRGCKILNTMWKGRPMIEPSKWSTYPFDTELNPYMEFECAPDRSIHVETGVVDRFDDRRYFAVVTNAGTMTYGKSKNWERTSWINDFIRLHEHIDCVLIGTENPGIAGGIEFLRQPLPEVLRVVKNAEFVLGLQGFLSIVAMFMHKVVILKHENSLVRFNHLHPAWSSHLFLFEEHPALDARSFPVGQQS
jgi:hypothetical protein